MKSLQLLTQKRGLYHTLSMSKQLSRYSAVKTQTNYFRNNVNSQLINYSILHRAFASKSFLFDVCHQYLFLGAILNCLSKSIYVY